MMPKEIYTPEQIEMLESIEYEKMLIITCQINTNENQTQC